METDTIQFIRRKPISATSNLIFQSLRPSINLTYASSYKFCMSWILDFVIWRNNSA